MQNIYKNYDEIMNDLEFSKGLLKFTTNIQIDLEYVNLI